MSKVSQISSVKIGGDNIITVQSMLKHSFLCYDEDDLRYLYNAGCDIMRFSLINESENDLRKFISISPFPLVCDIQGSMNQAVCAIKCGCQGVRINPGNFNKRDLKQLCSLANDNNVCIRIGINEASLNGGNALEKIEEYIDFFEKESFNNLVISIKSSSHQRTLDLNSQYVQHFEYPLHIGLTEAGEGVCSAVSSTFVMSQLLKNGIGDTIRYSISGDEILEIESGMELLRCFGKRKALRIISCPMCARHSIETDILSRRVKKYIFSNCNVRDYDKTIAIMGCAVNGRGEAGNADIALCGVGNAVEIYKDGEMVDKWKVDEVEKKMLKIFDF